ncbi:hypothetical protein [Sphingobium sp. CFD-2]|uniref:hypothetical protein n=1 Tax=Sphingobium sp. CFD-2 TaxID=2878542 RepID=UPI00214CB9DF|nr:hypothetical protein [Sphingobium sp. CFD-2]
MEKRAQERGKAFWGRISQLSQLHADIAGEAGQGDRGVDIIAEAVFAGRPLRLVVMVKTYGGPCMERPAAYQLRRCLEPGIVLYHRSWF